VRVPALAIGSLVLAAAACGAFGADTSSSSSSSGAPGDASADADALADAPDDAPIDDPNFDGGSLLDLPAPCLRAPIFTDDFERATPAGSPWGTTTDPIPFLSIDTRGHAGSARSLLVDLSSANAPGSVNGVLARPTTIASAQGDVCVTFFLAARVADFTTIGGYVTLLDLRMAGPQNIGTTVSLDIDHRGIFLSAGSMASQVTVPAPLDDRFRLWAVVVTPATGAAQAYTNGTSVTTSVAFPEPSTKVNVALGADSTDLTTTGKLQLHVDDIAVR
jgi:hypothetical protein